MFERHFRFLSQVQENHHCRRTIDTLIKILLKARLAESLVQAKLVYYLTLKGHEQIA